VCVCVCAHPEFVPIQLLNSIVNIKETLYEHHANGGHSNAVFKILDNGFVITWLMHELVKVKLH